MAAARFGTLSDGTEIAEVTIAAGELSVKVITFGAVIRDVRLTGIDHPLVLGFDQLDDYVHHSPHFGAVAGRCANRIGGGRLVIDGHLNQLSLNEKGRTHLHGGFKGFGKRAWRLVAHDHDPLTSWRTQQRYQVGSQPIVREECPCGEDRTLPSGRGAVARALRHNGARTAIRSTADGEGANR